MKGFLGHRPRLDVVRGSLVFAGADRARSDELGLIAERKWSQDVYCHLKGVPTFLAFAAAPDDRCALELRCALSWRATGDDSVRGVHEFALELRDWRDLGYGARLEWLDDAMRKFLCRALAMRLETRHGAPVFQGHPVERAPGANAANAKTSLGNVGGQKALPNRTRS